MAGKWGLHTGPTGAHLEEVSVRPGVTAERDGRSRSGRSTMQLSGPSVSWGFTR